MIEDDPPASVFVVILPMRVPKNNSYFTFFLNLPEMLPLHQCNGWYSYRAAMQDKSPFLLLPWPAVRRFTVSGPRRLK